MRGNLILPESNLTAKRLQALKWMSQKMDGMTTREIAEEAGLSHDTITNRLSWADRAGLFASFEDKLLQELIPAAHKALLSALEDGDAAVALELYKGTRLLGKEKDKPANKTKAINAPQTEDESLDFYITQLRNQSQLAQETIDGSVEGQVKLLEEGIPANDGELEPVLRSDDGGEMASDD